MESVSEKAFRSVCIYYKNNRGGNLFVTYSAGYEQLASKETQEWKIKGKMTMNSPFPKEVQSFLI